MTEKRLYELAYDGALAIWDLEHKRLERNPQNRITQYKEAKAWIELEEIRERMLKLENR